MDELEKGKGTGSWKGRTLPIRKNSPLKDARN